MQRRALLAAVLLSALLTTAAKTADPLAAEIDRWITFLQSPKAGGESWAQLKGPMLPVLTRAADALHDGRRLLALQRYASARANLEGAAYAASQTRKTDAALNAEWVRLRGQLEEPVTKLLSRSPDDIQPSALRALAEAAAPQVRAFYEASLDFGRSTEPDSGFFYLGAAKGQRDFIPFVRSLSEKTSRRAPSLRSLDRDLLSLEGELLAAYRPPASIDRHSEFIGASSMVKEARELDAAGLRYGAMVRYLEAARRTAQITTALLPRETIETRLRAFASRIASGNIDHTIAQIYVEAAQADLQKPPDAGPVIASAIVSSVLPRYFAALEPAPPAAHPTPKVIVTLVRWPYT